LPISSSTCAPNNCARNGIKIKLPRQSVQVLEMLLERRGESESLGFGNDLFPA